MSIKKHLCLRYFIVPIEEHLFLKPVSRDVQQEWFRDALLKNIDFPDHKEPRFAVRIIGGGQKELAPDDNDLIYGKLGVLKRSPRGQKTPNDIIIRTEDDWHFVGFVCDMRKNHQYIAIEYDKAIIRSVSAFKKSLQEYANTRMFVHGYSVAFELLVEEKAFWKLVNAAERIYSIKFSLHSPNLFGAGEEVNKALKKIQSKFNNTEIDVQLSNRNGKLQVPKGETESYQEYADKGGGSWRLTVLRNSRKMSHSSTEQAMVISIEAEERANPETLKVVLDKFIKRLL